MNINLGKLTITIGVNTKEADQGIKGTGDNLDGLTEKAAANGVAWGKWAAGVGIAAAAAAAAIIKSSLSAITELDQLAKVAGITTDEFERNAFAARSAGIEQEKYADIIKNVNDKMGEFISTGAGPMKDFFDKIGAKVGVTAESFRKLSGPDALQLYVDTLEKAGANQKETTHYMEDLANDSTRLLPLLQNNGEAMRAMAERAKELGIGLSQVDTQKAVEAQKALSEIGDVIGSQVKSAVAELSPFITAIAKEMTDFVASSGGIKSYVVPAFEKIAYVVGIFADGLHGIRIIFKGVEIVARGFIAAVSVGFDLIIKAAASVGNAIIDGIATPFNAVIATLAPFSDSAKQAQKAFGDLVKSIKFEGIKGVTDFANAQIEAMQTAKSEMGALLEQEIPSSKIEAFIERVKKAAQDAAPTIASSLKGDTAGVGGGAPSAPTEDVVALQESDTYAADRTQEMFDAMVAESELRAETLTERYANEAELLRQGLELKYLTEQEYSLLSKQLAEDEARFKADVVMSTMDAIVEAISIGGKKASKLQQALAITNAVIHGKEAAVAAWNAGMSTGGPWAPFVAAAYTAASIARTASMISSIKSGGSSMGGMGGGGASVPSTPSGASGGGSEGSGENTSRSIDINFIGQGLMNTDQVRALIGQINEQVGDGVKLNVTGG